ncbi:hypothetical protein CDO52_25375 [Nocardiopsis gilva YIM 90087]|uniref:Lipoprotein n=1 Tax=Nocardiopsis gilva YIM 90087 TaxID=1235441 RepID=A0A223SBZ7_9ACTN|nr:hypothetical protein [Nocardiopsis gilva]ASU85691.1 hypothetical protein CDO52_25375 [Nocardiopsis gilva YIM 90087]
MDMTRLAVVGALCALTAVAGCGDRNGGSGGGPGGAPSPTDRTATAGEPTPTDGDGRDDGEIYVFNTYGNEEGFRDQRPKVLVASEFTTFSDLTWSGWGQSPAVGEGTVSGTWCLPECQDDPFPVTVELDTPKDFDGDDYYTAYSVPDDSELPPDMKERMEEADGGRLMVPSTD